MADNFIYIRPSKDQLDPREWVTTMERLKLILSSLNTEDLDLQSQIDTLTTNLATQIALEASDVSSLSASIATKEGKRTILSSIAITSGSVNKIEHGLGRSFIGYSIIKTNAELLTYISSDANIDTNLYLPLIVSTSCTISLEVW